MKPLITKDDVLNTRDSLLAKGKPAGARAIYNHLGRGSFTTITRFLREIDAVTPKPENQAETQEAFRRFWTLATDAGREHAEAQIKELEETQLGLMEENDRLQAELQQTHERAVELEKAQNGLTQDLRQALEAAEKARAAGEGYTSKFAEALERIEGLQADHASALKTQRDNFDKSLTDAEGRIQKLQAELAAERSEHAQSLDTARNRIHELEVALARAETKLESVSAPSTRPKG